MPKKVAQKGGAKNRRKDAIDGEHLLDMWEALARGSESIFGQFGEYKTVWAECAARPDLVNLLDLLGCLMKVSPTLNVGYGDLKEVCLLFFQETPSA